MPETRRERERRYYRERSDIINARRRARYWADPEKARAKHREYVRTHREICTASTRRWLAKHPHKTQIYSAIHRARRKLRRFAYKLDKI